LSKKLNLVEKQQSVKLPNFNIIVLKRQYGYYENIRIVTIM